MKMIITLGILFFLMVAAVIFLLFRFQEKFIFFPQKLDSSFKFSFMEPFQERVFQISENVRIHALHFKTDDPKGLVFYLHGNAGSLQGWGAVAGDFLPFHFDVLMIDYRGYGKSNGKITEKTLLMDALSIFDSLSGEYKESRIVIYGRSLGTGIASYVASKRDPGMLILESPYYNIPDAAKSYFPWFPSILIRFKLRNDLFLQKVRCPVYIFHGTNDEVLNVKGSYKLKPLLKPGNQLYLIEGGHHNDLAMYDEYWNHLEKILSRFPPE
jgi:pimeloyl-ACP methyl ester carboxylesterase